MVDLCSCSYRAHKETRGSKVLVLKTGVDKFSKLILNVYFNVSIKKGAWYQPISELLG